MTATTDDFEPDSVVLLSGSLIDGELVAGDGTSYDIVRPSDGKVVRRDRGASTQLVDAAVQAAAHAHATSGWSTMAPHERASVMRSWASLVEEHAVELARIEAVGSTRLIAEAHRVDLPIVARILHYYAGLIEQIEGEVLPSKADVWRFTVREPYGVVAAITPWNAPLLLATMKLAPALAAGCAVVIKPSEHTPSSLLRLAQLAHEAGVPPGQLGVVPGLGAETGTALVEHPLVETVTFTGSVAVGARVMAAAAASGPKPVSLELGGKSPQLVFDDVDLDRVASLVAHYVCRNSGQACWAGTRLVAHAAIVDELVEKVAQHMAAEVAGPTWHASSSLAPIVSAAQGARIDDIVQRAVAGGATVVAGGGFMDVPHGGVYYRPTILTTPAADSPVVREEVFGPVLAVQAFREMDEAIAIANGSTFALVAGVHTRDLKTALLAARAIHAGTVWVNDYGRLDPVMPFGGHKQSGFGKDLGAAALERCLRTKCISIKT